MAGIVRMQTCRPSMWTRLPAAVQPPPGSTAGQFRSRYTRWIASVAPARWRLACAKAAKGSVIWEMRYMPFRLAMCGSRFPCSGICRAVRYAPQAADIGACSTASPFWSGENLQTCRDRGLAQYADGAARYFYKAGISGDQPACQGAASARMGRGAGSAVLRRARLFRIR